MLKAFRYGLLIALAGCMLLVQPLMAAEGIKGNLVSVDWLEKNLKKPQPQGQGDGRLRIAVSEPGKRQQAQQRKADIGQLIQTGPRRGQLLDTTRNCCGNKRAMEQAPCNPEDTDGGHGESVLPSTRTTGSCSATAAGKRVLVE